VLLTLNIKNSVLSYLLFPTFCSLLKDMCHGLSVPTLKRRKKNNLSLVGNSAPYRGAMGRGRLWVRACTRGMTLGDEQARGSVHPGLDDNLVMILYEEIHHSTPGKISFCTTYWYPKSMNNKQWLEFQLFNHSDFEI